MNEPRTRQPDQTTARQGMPSPYMTIKAKSTARRIQPTCKNTQRKAKQNQPMRDHSNQADRSRQGKQNNAEPNQNRTMGTPISLSGIPISLSSSPISLSGIPPDESSVMTMSKLSLEKTCKQATLELKQPLHLLERRCTGSYLTPRANCIHDIDCRHTCLQ